MGGGVTSGDIKGGAVTVSCGLALGPIGAYVEISYSQNSGVVWGSGLAAGAQEHCTVGFSWNW